VPSISRCWETTTGIEIFHMKETPMFNLRNCSSWLLGMLFASLFVVLPTPVARAQSITGTISGTVTDVNGSVLPGATVTLTSEQTGATRVATTNEEGRFAFAAQHPGEYILKVAQTGFQTMERRRVILSANETLALDDLKMQPGQVSETVSVTAEGGLVEKETSDLTGRLTADQINLISTKGRDITSLLRLIPGTSNNDDIEAVGEGFGTDLPNFSGARGRSAVAMVDGLFAGEPSGSNKLSMTINQDAVSEVKVLRNNYSAEFGNNGGALINVVSKGGGKDYAGSAYYFVRNESLNANNYFNNRSNIAKPLYRHKIPGFNFGGPLPLPRFGEGGPSLMAKDKLFFFLSIEKPRTLTPTDPVTVTVPTALERIGNFSQSRNSNGVLPVVLDPVTGVQFPGNIIPTNRINKSGQALLNYFPLPNSPTAANPGRYINQQSVDVPKHSYLIRFDAKPTNNDSFYWKAQWWTSDNEGLGTSGWPNGSGGVDRWGISSHYLYKDNGWSASWVRIVSPKVVNEFNFGMRHDSEGFIPSEGMIDGLTRTALNYTAPQLFPANNKFGLVPTATGWTSVAGNPANINWLDRWGETGNDYIKPSFADNVSVIHGNHSLKFGVYYQRLMNREAPGGGKWSGDLNFGTASTFTTALGSTGFAYSNALLGNFQTYTEPQARNFTNSQITILQWYALDDWKMNKRLTLNYGLRLGYHSPFFQLDGQGSNFDPSRWDPAKAPLLYAGYCVGQPGGIPPLGTACSAANSRAVDPRNLPNPTTAQLLSANLVRSFVPGTGDLLNGIVLPNDPTGPKGFRHTAPVDWEPRVGIAWDIFGSGNTVLRAMGGVYHAPRIGGGTGGAGASSLGANPPQQRTFTVSFGNIDQIPSLLPGAVNFPTALRSLEVNSKTPTIYNFQAGIQQEIGFKTLMEVSYVGSFARHLGEQRNINGVPDGARFVDCRVIPAALCRPENRDPLTAANPKNNDLLRPYRGYGDINQNTWSGTSNYNGLQVQVNRRYAQGFQFGVAYTYSKSFDYANDDTSDVNRSRPYKAFNYAVSDFDQTHILTVNYIYDVPRLSRKWNNFLVRTIFDDWQISGTTSYVTGKPKNITVSYTAGTVTVTAGQICPPGSFQTSATVCTMITDFTGGQVNARPFVLCDPMSGGGGSDSSGSPYVINVGCFTNPTALGQIGDMGRNFVRMPSIFNNDLAFFKNFRVGEKREVQLRWEIYNIFNRANFRDIDGGLTYALRAVTNSNGTTGAAIFQTKDTALGQATSFGTPISARTPRVMQGSIRINF